MDDYELGDVVNVYFPFEENPAETKYRPAVIIEDLDDECVLVKCTKTEVSLHGKQCILISKGSTEGRTMGLTEKTYISVNEELIIKKYHIHSYRGSCPDHIMALIEELKG